jgi:hypothetical protein
MSCSVAWDEAGLSGFGTAPRAAFWIALEQNGPWGRQALTESRLDRELAAALEGAVGTGRLVLIRRPGAHADLHDRPLRQVFVAGGFGGRPWLLAGTVDDPARLLDLPLARLAGASAAEVLAEVGWLGVHSGAVLLVCTNGRRDVCCALRGRPIALALERSRPGRVWESTHTGGHRFAPTGVVLPVGQTIGRLTEEVAVAVLDAADAGRFAVEALGPWHDRGRGHLPPVLAGAEAHVRQLIAETDPAALRCAPDGRTGRGELVEVTHRDGRRWLLRLTLEPHDDLPESCGKAAVAARSWRVETVT